MSNSTTIKEAVEDIQDPTLKARARALLDISPRYRRGLVANADNKGRVGWIPWQEATAQGPTGTPENQLTERHIRGSVAQNAPLDRRTTPQRVEALAKRMWEQIQVTPEMAPLILKEIQTEYWREGLPVTFEDLKEVAVELLKRAALAAGASTKGRK